MKCNNQHNIKPFSLAPVALALLSALVSNQSQAGNYFNPAFLASDPAAVADLSRFEGNGQAAGKYRVEIWLNGSFLTTRDVTFNARGKNDKNSSDDTGLIACLTPKALQNMGVNIKAIPDLAKAPADSCVDIEKTIPSALSSFDFEHQKLDISIPQAAMNNNARGYIPPEEWDEGINALLVNYQFTGSNSQDHTEGGNSDNNYFLGLNSGINLGPWRLRDYSSWNYDSSNRDEKSKWDHISTYVQRAIIPLKSELTMGDSYTPSDIFDSVPFRGVQLESDDNMLPDSLRGFAPTVRGIAKSNAQVTIKQNGYVIYQSYVTPGAFAIDDLFPTSSSGDLTVEVKESDGSVTSYSVPYSAVPVLQREGRVKYAVTAAEYRGNSDQQDDMNFAQGTLTWGLPHGFTAYGGSQLSDDYAAFALGGGVNMGNFGAISVDVTQAHSTLADDSTHDGQSIRFLYAKSLNDLGTNFQLLGYRYSTSGFYTLDDTAYKHMDGYTADFDDDDDQEDAPVWASYYNLYYSKRGKVQLNVSQQLNDYGSIFITGSQQSYWNTDNTDTLMQVGYSGTFAGISYSLSYNYSKNAGAPESDQIYALNISLPLSRWLTPGGDISQSSNNNAYATYSLSTDRHGTTTQNAGVNGTLLESNNLNYSIQQGYQNHGTGASGSASLQYNGGYGSANAGYNYSSNGDYQQVNYGLSGGVVAHRNGITLSQPLGDTNVLIAAPGADNVNVEGQAGVHTDLRGYAVVPYATTYRQNRMALDTNSMGDDLDIDDAVTNVVPTKGALVRAEFKAHKGLRALLKLTHNGKPVPFGAVVSRSDSGGDSIVGENGEAYLAGLAPNGTIKAVWGSESRQQCTANYAISNNKLKVAIVKENVTCQ
ncbi:TPA: fimbrial biogenesis usher protein [Enterobacter asburiae]|uniref:fimbrial biogenesis usher protein n=1 Tax=Enterobacter asburiae TaxID=61645 RepID=UPI001F47EC47|nr:fimbrial biogenesis usher protein [Enterobacter asburiae]MCF1340950.1 fimbrial biogenesis usher protein [Enterobacter asburiae]MCM6996794.1 fimbrial biogenesis usher protein [Enterobacter asburiae]MCQ4339328.1 fimbrial biogenesis usher protein [Enterobacter asburiae]HDC4533960.1 fimbrial biogenesis usher protein [Enterobacter asburiae]HDC4561749.1 fimbrial biogenesis usher protein [Enterobacter asburiae]